VVLIMIARHYNNLRDLPLVDAVFRALRPVVTALILFAVYRLGRTSISDWRTGLLFLAALAALGLRVHPLWVAVGGTALGVVLIRVAR
jgi:chromate transporter